MRYAEVCTSIEAEKMEIQCRRFTARTPKKDAKLGKTVYPFKLSIHGFARVTEAYAKDAILYRDESHTGSDDELHGTTVDGFAVKPLGKQRVEHATGTHKATYVQCRGGVYAHVEIGVREHLAKDQQELAGGEQ